MLENNFNSKTLKLQSNAAYNSSVDEQCEEAIPDTGASTHFLKKEAIKIAQKLSKKMMAHRQPLQTGAK